LPTELDTSLPTTAPNDTAVAAICRELNLADPARRRLRYLGHIINLSAKDLLFGKEEGSSDFEVSEMAKVKMEMRQALELLAPEVSHQQVAQSHSLDPERPQRIQKFKDLTTEETDARNSRCSFPQSD
jgi:hypothetical protein